MIVSVDTDNLLTPTMLAQYGAYSKYRTGIRAALEALGIDLPEPFKRLREGGRRPRMDPPSKTTMWRDRKKAEAAAQASR
jgi:hypothetical protein